MRTIGSSTHFREGEHVAGCGDGYTASWTGDVVLYGLPRRAFAGITTGRWTTAANDAAEALQLGPGDRSAGPDRSGRWRGWPCSTAAR